MPGRLLGREQGGGFDDGQQEGEEEAKVEQDHVDRIERTHPSIHLLSPLQMHRDHDEYVCLFGRRKKLIGIIVCTFQSNHSQNGGSILFGVEKEFLVEVPDFVRKSLFRSHLALIVFQSLSNHVQHIPQVCIGSSIHEDAAEAFYEPGATITIPIGNVAWQSGIGDQHVFPGNLLEVILVSVRCWFSWLDPPCIAVCSLFR